MATAKIVSKLGDKLTEIDNSFTINMYDNGFMIEAYGENTEHDRSAARIITATVDELVALVREACEMKRSD